MLPFCTKNTNTLIIPELFFPLGHEKSVRISLPVGRQQWSVQRAHSVQS